MTRRLSTEPLPNGMVNVSPAPKLAITQDQAAESLGVSKRTVERLVADRSSGFPWFKVYSLTLVPVLELQAWISDKAEGTQP